MARDYFTWTSLLKSTSARENFLFRNSSQSDFAFALLPTVKRSIVAVPVDLIDGGE